MSEAGGFVYCIVHHERKAVKIGFSQNPWRRLKQLQTASPDPFSLFGEIPGDRDLEAAFHQFFAGRRMHGEWFDDADHGITDVFGKMAWEAHMGVA